MAAGNFSIIKATDISSFKLGSTAWSSADIVSTTTPLDTSFATNNATILANFVGTLDAENPVKSAAFIKEISFSGNERSTDDENLVGKDATGAQNQEVIGGSVSSITCELTLVYRNNIPFSLFNDTTKCALMEVDTEESAATGKMNFAMNDITVTKVGDLSRDADSGAMEQKFVFKFSGGTTGDVITVNQASPAEIWSKVAGGDYAEEIRTA